MWQALLLSTLHILYRLVLMKISYTHFTEEESEAQKS